MPVAMLGGGALWLTGLARQRLTCDAVVQEMTVDSDGVPLPSKVAALLAADGKRYATALAHASTVADTGRPTPADGLAEAADRAAGDLLPPIRTAIVAMSKAVTDGRKSDAHRARDLASEAMTALADVQAIARWASGEPYEVRSPALPAALVEGWRDATEALDGVPVDQSWRARQALAESRAKWLAAETRASNFIARRDEVAPAAPVT